MTTCPKGHPSTDCDYCSECGSKIDGASGAMPGDGAADLSGPPPQPTGTGEVCPECGMERQQNVRFCETCRYDFVNKVPGPAPVAAAPAPGAAPPGLAGS